MREIVHNKGIKFKVVDTPGTLSWGFWDFFASGQWEPTTLEAADRLLKPGDLLLDIGAWVGPLTLWEVSRAVNVVAVEPDPEAFEALKQNVAANGFDNQVRFEQIAITDHFGSMHLWQNDVTGDSQSSLTRNDMPKSVVVQCDTLGYLLEKYGTPNVIKMDIEGGESLVLPEYGPLLRKWGVPILLALHSNWYAPGTTDAVEKELSHWNMEDLRNSMYLCMP